ncbi:hypothetical protein [Nostoc sp. UHCC 0252]|uniref:hypothetical protein n=1 Tax=Nostoc sp. UHCC 0252 TaxID=3110241 RepID=UPI002B1FE19B|nr:hypothetical protein [Nostoc sp. UHCC 0252]MEA5605215.1 hypothetical protein [Nostoc sp. UHCC 0252]
MPAGAGIFSEIGEKVAKLLGAAMQRLKTLPRESFKKFSQLLPENEILTNWMHT